MVVHAGDEPALVGPLGAGGYAPGTVSGNFLPLFWQSGTDAYVHSVDPYNGNSSQGEAALLWTAPVAGTIDYSGYLFYGQPSESRRNDVTFSIDGIAQFTQTIGYDSYEDSSDPFTFSGSGVSVTAGETLSLVFVRDQAPGTVTAYNLTVVETPSAPEPSTWAMSLLGFGLLGWIGLRPRATAATA